MKYTSFDSIIIVTPIVAAVDEDSIETFGTPVTQRASVEQIDGTRYFKLEELTDRVIYRIITWSNNFGNNFKITYNGTVLYPIRPTTVNQDKHSKRDMVTIYASAKV